MPRHPGVYARMLGERLAAHDVPVWLINTGWTGGPYGTGERINIALTREIVRAALEGGLGRASTRRDPVFGLEVPVAVAGVPDRVLDPRRTWSDPDAYDQAARRLARMFAQNFEQFESGVSRAIGSAGPDVA
ncbi:hypothetical protein BH23CHL8_BH23CHL8_06620 [soil metagenome]